ncbi:hypothetical protein [Nocardioides sp. AX2bis]|uniref:hypothetical protein n=1 Tax=Nocardioides sp. AX2bis TaxID=2653157 RepID=UPI0012F33EE3|nr:hypothetical protein [Nocardioides sp. AX2bis]VXB32828.1 hypothetical protein NOCARDAX2BIS_210057 [Nocardioides sp. AX2bis]
MDTLTHDLTVLVRRHLRTELLRLARAEEDTAADVAATVRYWQPCPDSVAGHRECAAVLRLAADAVDTRPSRG